MNKKFTLVGVCLAALAFFYIVNLRFGRDNIMPASSKPKTNGSFPAIVATKSKDPVIAQENKPAETIATLDESGDMVVEMAASLTEKNMLFWPNSYALTFSVQNALKINPKQALLIEELTKKAAHDVASALVNEAKLIKSPKGDLFFAIPKECDPGFM
jgi:hypothetical protein